MFPWPRRDSRKKTGPAWMWWPQTTFRVDFTLQVGAATESVTITAEAPELKTESGELSHNVSTASMDSLPILTIGSDGAGVRNPLAALNLLPGANFASDANLVINGMPSSSQTIRIEGQDATSGFWKEINSQNQTGVDAIQEVVVETSNFAAEYGQAGGGYINYTMKSGTNQYHGGGVRLLRQRSSECRHAIHRRGFDQLTEGQSTGAQPRCAKTISAAPSAVRWIWAGCITAPTGPSSSSATSSTPTTL